METQITLPPELAAHSTAATAATEVQSPLIKDEQSSSSPPPAAASTTPPAEAVNKVDTKVSDTVDAPVGPSASLAPQEAPVKMEEPQSAPTEKGPEKEEQKTEEVKKLEKEEQVASTKLEPAVEVAATVEKEETATKMATEASQPSPSEPEPAAPQTQSAALISASEPEPTPAETAEPPLSNGLPPDTEELSEDMAFSDTTPLDKPDASLSQESTPVVKTAMPAQEEVKEEENKEKSEDGPPTTVSCPTEESTTMQGKVELILVCIYDYLCHAGPCEFFMLKSFFLKLLHLCQRRGRT